MSYLLRVRLNNPRPSYSEFWIKSTLGSIKFPSGMLKIGKELDLTVLPIDI